MIYWILIFLLVNFILSFPYIIYKFGIFKEIKKINKTKEERDWDRFWG